MDRNQSGTISPLFGRDLLRSQQANAARLGFRVDQPALTGLDAGTVPPSLNCTYQNFGISPP